MSTVCVLKVGAFWACSLQKGLQQDRIACLAGQVRLPAPADIFESAERNYWDQRCPDTTASFEAMETWSWQWLSSLRRMPRPLSRRRQLTTKPRFLAVIDTSVWEAKQMRQVAQCFVGSNPGCGHGTTHLSHAEAASDMPQLEEPTTKNIQLFTGGLWGEKGKK
ncbi:uncharacterized protein [Equus caballus]|uniref:uncharacterized protein isoform X7 n=1 Tax=Equus caballus TaxID=9796 RepID=UPI0038B30214